MNLTSFNLHTSDFQKSPPPYSPPPPYYGCHHPAPPHSRFNALSPRTRPQQTVEPHYRAEQLRKAIDENKNKKQIN